MWLFLRSVGGRSAVGNVAHRIGQMPYPAPWERRVAYFGCPGRAAIRPLMPMCGRSGVGLDYARLLLYWRTCVVLLEIYIGAAGGGWRPTIRR